MRRNPMQRGLSLRHQITVGLFVAIAAAVVVPIVMASAANSAPSARPDPGWLRADTTADVVYPDGATVARPAIQAAAPKVDRGSAVAKVRSAGFAEELQPGTPEVALRSVTRQLKGQAAADYADRLAWVVTYRGSQPQVRGPMTMKQEERKKLSASLYCVMVFLVDAGTSEVFDAQQFCKS
ncbi:hypothetical protein [Dactylosporangium maewongense]